MNRDEIVEIIKLTINELRYQDLIQDDYIEIRGIVESELRYFFKGNYESSICKILNELNDDDYIDIVYHIYRDGLTLERIAEIMGKDVSTISRNKKRLICEIYRLMKKTEE